MIATHEYVKEKFGEFNRLIFGGKLPTLPICMSNARTFLGACTYKRKKNWLGKTVLYDFKLKISKRLDLPENEIEDIIIHEMIHYYIAINKMKDSSAHGSLFRQMMNDINTKYGRHITISHKMTSEQHLASADKTEKWHVVAVVSMKNGKTGVKVLPRTKSGIAKYHNGVMKSGEVDEVKLYICKDAYFNRFPTSSALRVYYPPLEDLSEHLKDAQTLNINFA